MDRNSPKCINFYLSSFKVYSVEIHVYCINIYGKSIRIQRVKPNCVANPEDTYPCDNLLHSKMIGTPFLTLFNNSSKTDISLSLNENMANN